VAMASAATTTSSSSSVQAPVGGGTCPIEIRNPAATASVRARRNNEASVMSG
jgi:hypothetical protein